MWGNIKRFWREFRCDHDGPCMQLEYKNKDVSIYICSQCNRVFWSSMGKGAGLSYNRWRKLLTVVDDDGAGYTDWKQ
jgi:hypothetical protein